MKKYWRLSGFFNQKILIPQLHDWKIGILQVWWRYKQSCRVLLNKKTDWMIVPLNYVLHQLDFSSLIRKMILLLDYQTDWCNEFMDMWICSLYCFKFLYRLCLCLLTSPIIIQFCYWCENYFLDDFVFEVIPGQFVLIYWGMIFLVRLWSYFSLFLRPLRGQIWITIE